MEKLVVADLKLGILGGGQLGKMLSLAASSWGIKTRILDFDDAAAAPICHEFVAGDFRNKQAVLDFGRQSDVLTIEIEQVNIEALKQLRDEGKKVYPEPEILEMIQDKWLQNQWLAANGFPKMEFENFESKNEILTAVYAGRLTLPFVQKSRQFGYDGKGVCVVRGAADLENLMACSSLVERCIDIKKEISVIAARNQQGEIAVYDPVEMVFNPDANLVDYLMCPAEIDQETAEYAQDVAVKIISRLKMTGVLAVEFFLDKEGKLWVNEMAPRPHNSGHHTIESCLTSQYEQHLRAIFNLPLGSTFAKMPAVMLNLLGEPGVEGNVRYEGLTECMGITGVKIHIYGKKKTKPYRKMGHVTVLDSDLNSAKKKAELVRQTLKVTA